MAAILLAGCVAVSIDCVMQTLYLLWWCMYVFTSGMVSVVIHLWVWLVGVVYYMYSSLSTQYWHCHDNTALANYIQ